MDDVDISNSKQDVLLEAQIRNIREQAKQSPKPTGYCLNCGEKLDNPLARWCDADCRDEWEKEHGSK